MKNLLIVHNMYANFGGEDSNIYSEVNNLSKSYKVYEFTKKNKKNISLIGMINLLTLNNFMINSELKKIIKNKKIDIVYIHNTWYEINLGIFKVLKKLNLKTIVKLHNFRFDCIEANHFRDDSICHDCEVNKRYSGVKNKCYKESYLKSYLITRYSKKLFKILKNESLLIFVFSKFHKNYLVKLGILDKKIKIQPNFINLKSKNSNYSIESDYTTLVGRLETGKGVSQVIDSFLKSKFKNLTLFVIGEGPIKLELENRYKKNLNVKFLGQLEYFDVLVILKKSKFNLFGSLMYEGQPMVLMEASGFGVPSLIPDNGGLKYFFPSDYELIYKHQIKNNLLSLLNSVDEKKLIESSKKIENFVKNNFTQAKLIKSFSNNI